MREDIEKRALEIGHYIVEKSATVRQTASVFRVSKSTVHKDVTERLPAIDHTSPFFPCTLPSSPNCR